MKSCPTCHRTYSDDTLNFCLDDGTALESDVVLRAEPPETIQIPASETIENRESKADSGRPMKGANIAPAASMNKQASQQLYRFDVFISYARADRQLVERLVRRLKEDQYTIWFDQEQMAGGGIVLRQLGEGIVNSAHMIACLSDNYIERDFTRFELDTNQALDPANKRNRTIPVVIGPLKNKEIPLTIIGLNRRNLTDPAVFDAEYKQLIRDISRNQEPPPPISLSEVALESLRRACKAPFERAANEPIIILFLIQRAARALCLFLHIREMGEPADEATFDALVERLLLLRDLPAPVRASLSTVQNYGNIVVKDQMEDQSAITRESIKPGLEALKVLVRWTFTNYFSFDPSEIEKIWEADKPPPQPRDEKNREAVKPPPPPLQTQRSGLSLCSEIPASLQNAWPLKEGRLLTWDRTNTLAVLEGTEVLWRDSSSLHPRRITCSADNRLAVGSWDGGVRCFAEGMLAAVAELHGVVGDLQFCAGRWVAGTWKNSLVSIAPTGGTTELLNVSNGVLGIAVMKDTDWFAVADLRGGVSLYHEGRRVTSIPPFDAVSGIAFAGRRVIVLDGDSICSIDLNGKVGRADQRYGNLRMRLVPSPYPDSCLLLTNLGESWLINEAGISQPYINLLKGETLLSTCRVPKRITVNLPQGGCAYRKDGVQQEVWPDAINANLAPDGRSVVVIFPDKVQTYKDP